MTTPPTDRARQVENIERLMTLLREYGDLVMQGMDHSVERHAKWLAENGVCVTPAPAGERGGEPTDVTDAQRWRWFRDHAHLAIGEDDDLMLGVWLAGENWWGLPWMTRARRRDLDGIGSGVVDDPEAIDAAVDHAATAVADPHDIGINTGPGPDTWDEAAAAARGYPMYNDGLRREPTDAMVEAARRARKCQRCSTVGGGWDGLDDKYTPDPDCRECLRYKLRAALATPSARSRDDE